MVNYQQYVDDDENSDEFEENGTPPQLVVHSAIDPVSHLNLETEHSFLTPRGNGVGLDNGDDFDELCRRTRKNIEERVQLLQEALKANDSGIYNEKMNGLAANHTEKTQLALQETRRRLEILKSRVRDREEKSRVLEGQVQILRREILKQSNMKLEGIKATQRRLTPLQTLFLYSILFLLFLRLLDRYDHSTNVFAT